MTDSADHPTDALPVATTDDPARLLLRWRSHPVRERSDRLLLVLGVLIGGPALLFWLYGPFFALLSIVILGGSLGSFFLPTDYALYVGGGEMRFIGINRRFTWAQFRTFYPDQYGVLLSPFTRPSRLENFRGIYVRFGRDREPIMRIVEANIQRHSDSESDTVEAAS
jgi:hypothetical protein